VLVKVPLHGVVRTTSVKTGELLVSEVKRLRPKASLTVKKITASKPTLIWSNSAKVNSANVLKAPDHKGGYVLDVSKIGVIAAAHDKTGLVNAVHTILCVMDQVKKNNRWPKLSVRDWPTLSF